MIFHSLRIDRPVQIVTYALIEKDMDVPDFTKWRAACQDANEPLCELGHEQWEKSKNVREKIKELEQDLRRKEKALVMRSRLV